MPMIEVEGGHTTWRAGQSPARPSGQRRPPGAFTNGTLASDLDRSTDGLDTDIRRIFGSRVRP